MPDSIKLLDEFDSNNCLTDVFLYELKKVFKGLSLKLGCTYASYLIESELTGKKVLTSTNPIWANCFYFENLIQGCPVVDALRKINSGSFQNSTLVWNSIKPYTREAKLVTGLRGDYSVSNGITFISFLPHNKYGCYLEVISFAADKLDINFHKEVLQNKKNISTLIYNLRCKGYKALSAENDKLFTAYMLRK